MLPLSVTPLNTAVRTPTLEALRTLPLASRKNNSPTQLKETAQALFQQLKECGYQEKDILTVSSELIGQVTEFLRNRQER